MPLVFGHQHSFIGLGIRSAHSCKEYQQQQKTIYEKYLPTHICLLKKQLANLLK
jgi:hypothetical protein